MRGEESRIIHANAYGFRTERSAQNVAEQIFNALRLKSSAQWVLEDDIKACFDEIDHHWLLKHVLMNRRVLKKRLKAGYMEKKRLPRHFDGHAAGRHHHCHRQVHHLMKLGADVSFLSANSTDRFPQGAYKGLSRMRGNPHVRC